MLSEDAKKFIRDNCREMTPDMIADVVGHAKQTIYSHIKSLGLKPHKIKKETAYLREPTQRFHE